MKITDQELIKDLTKEFEQKHEEFNKVKYVSKISESQRILKIIRCKYFKKDLETIFKILTGMLAKDMHAHLNYEDLENNAFYRAGKKDKKRFMHLSAFKENEEITLEWFTKESWIAKNFQFKKSWKGLTKVSYLVIIKGDKTKGGYLEKIMQNRYIKAENLRFDIEMLTLSRKLNLLDKLTEEQYQIKLQRLTKKLTKVPMFSIQ